MKNVTKHHSVSSKSKSQSTKKSRFNRGALGAGTAYAILAMLVIGAAGSMMIGSIVPNSKSPDSGQSVIISTNTPEPKKSNLQLYYFPGATETPTPSPTLPPQPDMNWGGGNGGGGGGDQGGGGGSGGGPGGNGSCFVAGT